jgi:hypothetical protein
MEETKMAITIKYDITEVGGERLEKEGIFTMKIKSVKEYTEGSSDQIIVVLMNKEEKEVSHFVPVEGKGAFLFRDLASALGVSLKEEGSLDVEKWVGKMLDVEVFYDEDYDRYKVKRVDKKGNMEAVGSTKKVVEEVVQTTHTPDTSWMEEDTPIVATPVVEEDEDDDWD